jgi:outer membrane protein TolC
MKYAKLGALLLSTVLTGCMVGPNFQPPQAAVPTGFIGDQPASQPQPYVSGDAVDPQWWNSFNDPTLTQLESQAVAQNLDLQIASQRLIEAEAPIFPAPLPTPGKTPARKAFSMRSAAPAAVLPPMPAQPPMAVPRRRAAAASTP